ncbi:uncharacterized protein LOC122499781 [Leptopilina heterotoma]|uniref:uncharacterized protein LOC122499781 n=1 Tax=Leptopilina heterotoma TaxID=63436 RepID=UPI001CA912B0|nr:uncharacterized protein LOC122499781 [Leptopilina heterotoma]
MERGKHLVELAKRQLLQDDNYISSRNGSASPSVEKEVYDPYEFVESEKSASHISPSVGSDSGINPKNTSENLSEKPDIELFSGNENGQNISDYFYTNVTDIQALENELISKNLSCQTNINSHCRRPHT